MHWLFRTMALAAALEIVGCGTTPLPPGLGDDAGTPDAATDAVGDGSTLLDVGTADAADVPAMDIPLGDLGATDVPTTDASTTDLGTTDVSTLDLPGDLGTTDVPTTDHATGDLGITDIPATGCDGACIVIMAPRAVAPLSTATVTSQTPVLQWALAAGDTGAQVEICHDSICETVEQFFTATGTTGTPTTPLSPGIHYWRLTGINGTTVGSALSLTWSFRVGYRSAPVNTAWGTTLDINGDGFADLAVGAYAAGTVSIYLGSATGLSTTPSTTLAGPSGSIGFGYSVANGGDINGDGFPDLIVGAYAGVGTHNTAYIYFGERTGPRETPTTTLTDPSAGGGFGYAVASAGDINRDGYGDVIVGTSASATAYVYFGGSEGTSPIPTTTLTGPTGFGRSVASAGDVNGDGFADIVVGAPQSSTAYVYLGSGIGPSTSPTTTLAGPSLSSSGISVSGAGDVNGDGYADVLVGASTANAAYIYFGSASGPGTSPTTTLTGPSLGSFGVSVAGAGDVNGDGFADILIGAPGNGSSTPAQAYVYFGSTSGPGPSPTILTGTMTSLFGQSVTGAGDIRDHGYTDAVVGAYGANTVYVYPGSATGVSTTPTTLTGPGGGPDAGTDFGFSLSR